MVTTTKQSKYEELELIQKELGEESAKLRARLRDVEEHLSAVTLAIKVWKSKGPSAGAGIESNPRLREFRGLTQVQALVKIAQDSGTNRLRLTDARNLLVEAGLVKSRKNATNILFNAIQRSEKFKRVAPGEYELITKSITVTAGFTADAVLKRASA